MAGTVTVRVKRRGVHHMLSAPFMVRYISARAFRVQAAAQRLAPVRTGLYRASIHTRIGIGASGAYARVIAPVHYAIFVERGTSKMRGQHVMYRALRSTL